MTPPGARPQPDGCRFPVYDDPAAADPDTVDCAWQDSPDPVLRARWDRYVHWDSSDGHPR